MCVCVTRWEIAKSFARCLIDSFLCILVVRYDVMYMFVGMRITLEGKLIDDDDLYVCMYVYVLADRYQPAEEQRYWFVFSVRFSSELSKGTKSLIIDRPDLRISGIRLQSCIIARISVQLTAVVILLTQLRTVQIDCSLSHCVVYLRHRARDIGDNACFSNKIECSYCY